MKRIDDKNPAATAQANRWTGARFYAIAFLVVFYYFFTKPVSTENSVVVNGESTRE